MTDILEELLAQDLAAAYAEGKEGRTHDTEDARAQKTLSAIRAEFRALRQRVADLEEEYKELRDKEID